MMRRGSFVLVMSMLCACVSHPASTRQYFDEKTAATITQTINPWIFTHERPEAAVNAGDYASVTGVDVNRSGDHRLYLITAAWSTIDRELWAQFEKPTLKFSADGRVITPQLLAANANSIGWGELPKDKRGLRRWVYSIDAEECAFLARSSHVRMTMQEAEEIVSLVPTNESGAALAELVDGRSEDLGKHR